MIRKLDKSYREQVLHFCLQNERENLFVIGSFNNYKETFESNRFYGYFKGEILTGLAVYFTRFSNLIVHGQTEKVIEELVDFAVSEDCVVKFVTAFKQYADAIVRRLVNTHGLKPKKVGDETVFTLISKDFQDFSDGTETIGTPHDVDDIVEFSTGKKADEITEADRLKVFPQQEFILRKEGAIVSKANIHGNSDHYFQIGGVITADTHRRKGYARQVVSALCSHFFKQGLKTALLFTGNENVAAQALYRSIGFKPDGHYVMAEF